jgi:two-component system LytT family response regulator
MENELISIKRSMVEKLSISTIKGFSLIKLTDILFLEADGNYTTIQLTDKSKVVSTRNLGYFEKILEHEPFLRIHNSKIVNLTKVTAYLRAENGYVILETGQPLSVSRSKRDELLDFFSRPLVVK